MKTFFRITSVIILTLLFNQSQAQVFGYGSGTLLSDPNISGSIHYTDNVRAKVTASSSSACGTDLQITISNTVGAFQVGDVALIIQMMGTGIGTHQNVEIISISGSNMCVRPISSTMHTYNFGTNNKVQIIKIDEYVDFTLNSGIVTCNDWDGNHGGILCMIVNGKLEINGGKFHVYGRGYSPLDAGVSYGIGTTGGTPSTSWSGGSVSTYAGAPIQMYICADAWYSSSTDFTKGDDGGTAGNNSPSRNTNNGTPAYYGGSQINTKLVMGDPGYFQPSTGGGTGGQGGGYGGDGANATTPCTGTGSSGSIGNAGDDGGDAGKGGRGGGAIVIKADNVDITTNAVVFDVSGQIGESGGYGGDGGFGGLGGEGGMGCCVTNVPYPGGGDGGNGDIGAGGHGADGGDGGKPGYIWIATQNTYTTVATNKNENFRAKGGKGGLRGLGGWGNFNNTDSRMYKENQCTNETCNGGASGCHTYFCNIEKVMCELKDAQNVSSSGGVYTFTNTSTVAEYNSSTSEIISYFTSCSSAATSRAYTTDATSGDCLGIFDIFENGWEISQTVGTTNYCTSNGTYPQEIKFKDLNGEEILKFSKPSLNAPAYIETGEAYTGAYKRCYLHTCYSYPGTGGAGFGIGGFDPYNGSPDPSRAASGDDGIDASDGTFDVGGTQDDEDNAYLDEGAPWLMSVQKALLTNSLNAQVFPNPAKEKVFVTLELEKPSTLSIEMKDITGKLIKTDMIKNVSGNYKTEISLDGIKPGVYLIQLQVDQKSSLFKITVN